VIIATSTGPYPIESLTAELEHLAHLASVVLNEHINDDGLCAVCPGVAFPCTSAVLAEEHNAALL